jgi:hypothetical protein
MNEEYASFNPWATATTTAIRAAVGTRAGARGSRVVTGDTWGELQGTGGR